MNRHYGMDWLRIGAFGLLIFYHIGMFFLPGEWHVHTARSTEWVKVPMLATNAWRLALLFVVSGYASAALFARSPQPCAFFRSRSARLLVPLVFAVVIIVPAQPWVELQFKHGYAHGFWYFWTHDYFRFGALNEIIMPTWQHLWFVVYLWFYTAVLALLLAILPTAAREKLTPFADTMLAGSRILWVPIALLLVHLALSWPGQEETHALIDDWQAHRIYFAVFLFGIFLHSATRAWAAIRIWWKVAAAISILAYGAAAGIQIAALLDAALPVWTQAAFEVARIFQGWCAIVALVGIADRYWNRDHPWRAMLTEAVFPFYIIHQTIIVLLGWYLLRLGLHPVGEFAILVVATAIGCWLFYAVGRRIGPLRPLIGLRRGSSLRVTAA